MSYPRPNYKLVVPFTTFLFCLGLSVPVLAATLDRVVAKVNSEIVTLSSVEGRVAAILNQIKAFGSSDKRPTENELMKQTLDAIIDEKLQIQEAKKIGMEVDEETTLKALDDIYKNNNITAEQFKAILISEGRDLESYKNIVRDQILTSQIIKMEVGNGTAVSEGEIRQYYLENKKDYQVPARPIASHIMFIHEKDVSEEETQLKKKKAQEILHRIRSGEDFSELAKKYSEDISGRSGGQIGVVERGVMMLEFEDAVFSLKVGEVSNIVETKNGFHIIKCDEILSEYFKTYKEVRSEIDRLLSISKREKKYQKWMKRLRRSAFIEMTLIEDTSKSGKVSRLGNGSFGSGKLKRVAKIKTPRKARRLSESQKKFAEDVDSVTHRTMESKLKLYKKLRDSGKISEQKYKEKKKELLKKF